MTLLPRLGLRTRILAAAGIGLVGLLVVAALSIVALRAQTNAIEAVGHVAPDRSAAAATFRASLDAAHIQLYDLLNTASNDSDAAKLAGQSRDLAKRLDVVDTNYHALRRILPDGADAERLASAKPLLVAYRAALVDVAEMAATDAASATNLALPAAIRAYRLLDVAAGTIAKDVDAARNAAAAAATVASQRSVLWVAVFTAALIVGCAGFALLVARAVARPLVRMIQVMNVLSQGGTDVLIPGIGRRDEIGAMANAISVFKTNAIHAREQEQEKSAMQARREAEDDRVRREAALAAAAQAATLVVGSIGLGLKQLAAGDLTFQVTDVLPEAYEQLRMDLNTAASELHALIRSIVTTTSEIRSGTEEMTRASDDLSRRTEQQAASLEQTAAALDEITATVRKTADSSKHAQAVASLTKEGAEQSGEVVRQAVAAMGGIEQSSQKIGDIIGVIDEIAFQTNLLALNAGVEAARAGDAGRGFAVVASEVRALAQRSAKAAKEIKALISNSARQVGVGVKLVGETGQALSRIVSQVAEVTTAVSEIAASAKEQAAGLAEVNTAINQMDQVTQQNAAMVEQSTAASHALAQETAELVRLTERFQTDAAPGGVAAKTPSKLAIKPPTASRDTAARIPLRVVAGTVARKRTGTEETWQEF